MAEIKLEKIAEGAYYVYLGENLIGTVKRIRWTSGSATEWKAQGIGWGWTGKGFQTRAMAVQHLEWAYENAQKEATK